MKKLLFKYLDRVPLVYSMLNQAFVALHIIYKGLIIVMRGKDNRRKISFYIEEFWKLSIFFMMVETFIAKFRRHIEFYSYCVKILNNIKDPFADFFVKDNNLLRAFACKEILVANYYIELNKSNDLILKIYNRALENLVACNRALNYRQKWKINIPNKLLNCWREILVVGINLACIYISKNDIFRLFEILEFHNYEFRFCLLTTRNIDFEDEIFRHFLSFKEDCEIKYCKYRLELFELNQIIMKNLPSFIMNIQSKYLGLSNNPSKLNNFEENSFTSCFMKLNSQNKVAKSQLLHSNSRNLSITTVKKSNEPNVFFNSPYSLKKKQGKHEVKASYSSDYNTTYRTDLISEGEVDNKMPEKHSSRSSFCEQNALNKKLQKFDKLKDPKVLTTTRYSLPYIDSSTLNMASEPILQNENKKKDTLFTVDDYYSSLINKKISEKANIQNYSQKSEQTSKIMKSEDFDKKEFIFADRMMSFKRNFWFGGNFDNSNIESYLSIERSEIPYQGRFIANSHDFELQQATKMEMGASYLRRMNNSMIFSDEKTATRQDEQLQNILGRRDSQYVKDVLQKMKTRRSFMYTEKPAMEGKSKGFIECKEEANKEILTMLDSYDEQRISEEKTSKKRKAMKRLKFMSSPPEIAQNINLYKGVNRSNFIKVITKAKGAFMRVLDSNRRRKSVIGTNFEINND